MSNPFPPEGDRPTYIDPATGQALYIDPATGQLAYGDPTAAPTPLTPSGPPNHPGFPPAGYPATPSYSPASYPPASATPAYPQSYPYAAYPYPVMPLQQRNNSMALAAMILSIVSVALLFCDGLGALVGLVGAILGHVARRQIAERGEGGAGMALSGIIIGWITFGIGVIGLILVLAFVVIPNN
jgi:hypothetical protein